MHNVQYTGHQHKINSLKKNIDCYWSRIKKKTIYKHSAKYLDTKYYIGNSNLSQLFLL